MAFDLLLDENSDLVISNRDFTFTQTRPDEVSQRVGMKLKTWQGEWFLDTTYGLPYMQQIISVARRARDVDPIFLNAVRSTEGVLRVENYKSEFDRVRRVYSLDMDVVIPEGSINIAFNSRPDEKYRYPDPVITDPRIECEPNDLFSDLRIDLWGDGTDLVGQLLSDKDGEIVANTLVNLTFVREDREGDKGRKVFTQTFTDSRGQFYLWSLDSILSEGWWTAYAESEVFSDNEDGSITSRAVHTNSLPFEIRLSDNNLSFLVTKTMTSPINVRLSGGLFSKYKSAIIAGSPINVTVKNKYKPSETYTFNSTVMLNGYYDFNAEIPTGVWIASASADLKFLNGKTRKIKSPQEYEIDVRQGAVPKLFRTGQSRTGENLNKLSLEYFEAGFSAPPERVVDFNTRPFKKQTVNITELHPIRII